MATKPQSNVFVVIDGHALLHRAYHGIPPLSLPTGQTVHGVYGFMMILLNVIRDLAPSHLMVAFDSKGPTFRHEQFEAYKAQRQAPPDDFGPQLELTKEVLGAFGVHFIELPGFEADDIIGTVVQELPEATSAIIVTGDLDELQLVNDRVRVFTMRRGFSDTMIYDAAAVRDRYGFGPALLIDYKALRGDPSDNIPGVAGIGEKTATDLVSRFGSLEEIYDRIEELPAKVAAKLSGSRELAFKSRELVTIKCDLDLKFELSQCRFGEFDRSSAKEALLKLGFKSLVAKIPGLARPQLIVEAKASGQFSLKERLLDAGAVRKLLGAHKSKIYLDLFTAGDRAVWSFLAGGEHFSLIDPTPDDLEILTATLNRTAGLIGFNLKNIYLALPELTATPIFDVMLAAYVIDANRRVDELADLALLELGEELKSLGKTAPANDSLAQIAAERVEVISILEPKLAGQLMGKPRQIFEVIELPLIPILAAIERHGVLLDTKYLRKLSSGFASEIEKVQSSIYAAAGHEFNISSTAQLKNALFDVMKIRSGELKRIKTGISTAASELEKLRGEHPIVEDIFRYRELTKLKSTYVDALPRLVSSEDGRLHTTYNSIGAATGRLSSNNPNLQNIPIRTEDGNRIRRAFRAAEGYKLLAADYSQIELRIAAHMSEDKQMITAFEQDVDFHTLTAARVYDVSPETVTKAQRRVAKAVNFGVLYGQGPHGLSQSSGLTYSDAADFIERYFELYSSLKRFLAATRRRAHELGYVETLLGRRRLIPELKSSNGAIRAAGERMAINMPIQGTDADIVKLAMIELAKLQAQTPMILQVHDEMLFEVKNDAVLTSAQQIRTIMESAYELLVPLKVEIESGDSWGEMTELIV